MLEIVDLSNFESCMDPSFTQYRQGYRGKFDEKLVNQVKHALQYQGFLVLKNVDKIVGNEDILKAFEVSKSIFEENDRQGMAMGRNSNNIGWQALGTEQLDPSKALDQKEGLNLGKFDNGSRSSFDQCVADGFVPKDPKDWPGVSKAVSENYNFLRSFSENCHNLCLILMELMAIALKIPDEDGLPGPGYFARRHRYQEPSGDILRFLMYPPQPIASVVAGAHSDYGSMTLLFTRQAGLEVLLPDMNIQIGNPDLEAIRQRKDHGIWHQVPVLPVGHVIVNTGDLMEAWTCGLWRSTIHRVLTLPSTEPRYSIPYFCHPEDSVPLTKVPSPLIHEHFTAPNKNAREWLQDKLLATTTY